MAVVNTITVTKSGGTFTDVDEMRAAIHTVLDNADYRADMADLRAANSLTATEEFDAEMTSFNPNTSCQATSDDVDIDGATLNGYLIDSSTALIADDTSVLNCSGVDKIVGVATLDSNVVITSATTGLTATFTVTDNGSSVYCGGVGEGCPNIHFDSGPFNVSFTVVE